MKVIWRRLKNEPAYVGIVVSNAITVVLAAAVPLPPVLTGLLAAANVVLLGGTVRGRVKLWSPEDAEDQAVTSPDELRDT